MAKQKIFFFSEEIPFTLKYKSKIRNWINSAIAEEGKKTGDINYIFCADDYLLRMNRSYLQHDTLTDIITFDTGEEQDVLSGDIFISVDRVKENAMTLAIGDQDELHRVMIHGILHLAGFTDKTKAERTKMRAREDHYILKKRIWQL